MIESSIEKEAVLSAFGSTLEFDNGTIKGIAEIELSILAGEQSVYAVERQSFQFQCHLSDIVDNDIVDGAVFTTDDGIYQYTFKLNRPPNTDLLGWCTLYADYITKEAL